MTIDLHFRSQTYIRQSTRGGPRGALKKILREGTFFFWEGGGGVGGAGLCGGGSLVKFLTNWGGPNLFCSLPGEGHTFLAKKKLPHVASIKVDSFIC